MKTRISVISLTTVLAVLMLSIRIFGIGSGPAAGSYVITNAANNLELVVNSSNDPILHNPNAYTWRLTEVPAGNPLYYTITTADGVSALAFEMDPSGGSNHSFYMAAPNSADSNQHWMITAVTGGYEIESMQAATGSLTTGNGYVLYADSRSMSVPGKVRMELKTSAANSQNVWRISAPPASPTATVSPTRTPTSTPTASALPKAPKPVTVPANGSYIRSNERVELKPPASLPNANVVYSMINPGRGGSITWYPSSTQINTPNSGTLEFWAKTLAVSGYQESDVERFIFHVQTGTVTPTPTPTKPLQPITQVILKVKMNSLDYTVNGIPYKFDVAPYLDTKANRSMIPMRFIAEAFGAAVHWDDLTKTQTISLDGKTFKLTENVPLPDGMGTPVLKQDRFFVPLRYVSQELGASVDWDNATQTNTIIYYK